MIDGEVRELGRRARADDDPVARLAWLVARLRAGLPRERLVLAAWAGDPAARALLGKAAPVVRPGPLHLAGADRYPRPAPRPWMVVMGNAGKVACRDAACDALEVASQAAGGVSAAAVIAACRGLDPAGPRDVARAARASIAREVAALSRSTGLDPRAVSQLTVRAEPREWRANAGLAVKAAPSVPPRHLVALTGELLALILADDKHRFAVLAAIAVRLATAIAAEASAAPVDAAVRAAVIRFALR